MCSLKACINDSKCSLRTLSKIRPMLVLQVSVRVVPESLILLLYDQIVPMLASPHWRLFSSCNTSITTTTLLRICFVPICFLAWKIIAREVLFFLAKTKVSQLHSRSNVRRNVIPMTSTTWSDLDSDHQLSLLPEQQLLPWQCLAEITTTTYYGLDGIALILPLEIKLEILMIANYFRDAKLHVAAMVTTTTSAGSYLDSSLIDSNSAERQSWNRDGNFGNLQLRYYYFYYYYYHY